MLRGVETKQRSPMTFIRCGRLEIHSAIARILRLGLLNSGAPFSVGLLHARLDLGENHLGDICPGLRRFRRFFFHDLPEISASHQGQKFADESSAFFGLLPSMQLGSGFEVQNHDPHVAMFTRRHDVAADVAGEFRDGRIMTALPCSKSVFAAWTDFCSGDEDSRRTHLRTEPSNPANCAKIRSALKGRLVKRIPVASARALPSAAETGMIGASAMDFAPKGP